MATCPSHPVTVSYICDDMPRYSSYGRLDTAEAEAGDRAFLRINNRIRPSQLEPGEVVESLNGRMDRGYQWVPRKAISSVSGVLTNEGSPLLLPFVLDDLGTPPTIDDQSVTEVYGSCVFSDPNNANSEYIVIALNGKAVAVKLADGTTTDIAYPGSDTVTNRVNLVQAFDYVYLFNEGVTPWRWDGDLTGSPAFAKVGNGTKTQHVIYTAATNTAASGGVVTVSETAHGRSVGDQIKIVDSSVAGLADGSIYEIHDVPDADTFRFYADVDDTGSAQSVVYSTTASLGGGFIYMPAAAWGTYHQRRFWLPYTHTAASSPASRNVTDELIASDILDPETFDPIGNQFRITAGIADFIVGVHPFNEDRLIVFNRNSIHMVSGVSGSLADTTTRELTREIGLVARRSVQTFGNQVMFLSDNGVYSISFMDEYNLRGTETPVSEPIQSTIDRINADLADTSVAVYHDNTYRIAVPLDSSPGAGDAAGLNAILVFNVLNQGWESIDSVNDPRWDIVDMQIGRSSKDNNLYLINSTGGVHLADDADDDRDDLAIEIGASTTEAIPISSSLETRQYNFDTLDRKRFHQLTIHAESTIITSDADIHLVTENPDAENAIGSILGILGDTLSSGEDASLRVRVGGVRAQGASVRITPSQGRPKIRAIGLQAQLAQRSTQSTN